jgi:hypothetical protein
MKIMKKKEKHNKNTDKEDNQHDSFELFLNSTPIRYAFYKETHKYLHSI